MSNNLPANHPDKEWDDWQDDATPPLQPDEELKALLGSYWSKQERLMHEFEHQHVDYNTYAKEKAEIDAEHISKLEAREQAARIVNRFEVINHLSDGSGREVRIWEGEPFKVELDLQDDGRTLKVFLMDNPSNRE